MTLKYMEKPYMVFRMGCWRTFQNDCLGCNPIKWWEWIIIKWNRDERVVLWNAGCVGAQVLTWAWMRMVWLSHFPWSIVMLVDACWTENGFSHEPWRYQGKMDGRIRRYVGRWWCWRRSHGHVRGLRVIGCLALVWLFWWWCISVLCMLGMLLSFFLISCLFYIQPMTGYSEDLLWDRLLH